MSYFFLGALLIAAFIVQDVMHWKWAWLETWQANETYKQITGALLVLYIAHQWILTALRANNAEQAAWVQLQRHKLWGAFAPVVFYLHSTEFGYAYLFYLSVVFFALLLLGLLNDETLSIKNMAFANGWMIVHVSLAVGLMTLMLFHIYIAFLYE